VLVTLADGTHITLHPYLLYGQRWVAFAVPASLPIASVTAYSGHSELAYAIAYDSVLVTWLRPGQQGLPRASYVIGSGVVNGVTWSDVVHVGPWGYCLVTYAPQASGSDCLPAQSVSDNALRGSGSFDGPGTLMNGTASPTVAYIVGTLTDGGTVRARAVAAGGLRFWAWVVPQGQRLRRVVFYSASGRQVVVQSGAAYNRVP
jgi:hypothetical protein